MTSSRVRCAGRDHVSATVNTLVLAYVGAALPVLLIFSASDLGAGEVVNLELVAKEVVSTLVGSIGLIAAVPITTVLAAALGSPRHPDRWRRACPCTGTDGLIAGTGERHGRGHQRGHE